MSTGASRTYVDSREVEQWVQAVFTYHDTSRSDIAGGVAPRTIKDVTGTDRAMETVKKYLRKDDRVESVKGISLSRGGHRESFEPRGDLA